MADIVLFHHAQGQTPGFHAFADTLRKAGHAVHTPDLFDGRTFSSIPEGLAYADSIGFDAFQQRVDSLVSELPEALVYSGFSIGVIHAQRLAQTRPYAKGALLFHSCLPHTESSPAWPEGVPVQIHGMDHDPHFVDDGDIDAARELVAHAQSGELFLYPGDQHCFADSSLTSYDPAAAALLESRTLAFLERLPA